MAHGTQELCTANGKVNGLPRRAHRRLRVAAGLLAVGLVGCQGCGRHQARRQPTAPAATVMSLPLRHNNESDGLAGLLGSDMLSRFGVVIIEYERQLLILRSRRQ